MSEVPLYRQALSPSVCARLFGEPALFSAPRLTGLYREPSMSSNPSEAELLGCEKVLLRSRATQQDQAARSEATGTYALHPEPCRVVGRSAQPLQRGG